MKPKLPNLKALTRLSRHGGGRDAQAELIRRADAARDRKDWTDAAALYREVLDLNPARHGVAIQMGHMLKEVGLLEAADEAYQSVLAIKPNDADLHLQIGHLRKLQRNYAGALLHYERALLIAPNNASARLERDGLNAWLARDNGPASAEILIPPRNTAPAIPKPQFQHVPSIRPQEQRVNGDRARDMRAWSEAVRWYREYLDQVPDDAAIWVQLGHSLKETGDLAGGEAAYRSALERTPDDADLHLQLGHVLKLRGQRAAALAAYRTSFGFDPLRASAIELRSLDPAFDLAAAIPKTGAVTNKILFEVTDLLDVLARSLAVSGIQRVQLGLLSYLVEATQEQVSRTRVVAWESGHLWAIPFLLLRKLLSTLREGTEDGATVRLPSLLREIKVQSKLMAPQAGDTLIETGATWLNGDLTGSHGRLKRLGVRLGACIYDFIPITHPEYCHTYLTERFSSAISAALLHLDFALTISDYTRRELKRLLVQGSYPEIPSQTVPLAQEKVPHTISRWTPAIADLQHGSFVLCVGTLHAHKNHALLVQVWRLLVQRGLEPPTLVLAGRRGYGVNDLFELLEATDYLDGRVRVADGLTDDELATLYRNCLFTAFPSAVEGWGLPIGESLAHGKVCVASNTTSMPEVGGDLALYVDPFNVRAITDTIAGLLGDRNALLVQEARIRREFRRRTWMDYGKDLLQATDALCKNDRLSPVALPPAQVIRPRQLAPWQRRGTGLPPRDVLVRQFMSRIVLTDGWHPVETWGAWTDGKLSHLSCNSTLPPGAPVRVLLQLRTIPWPRQNSLTARSGCGAQRSVSLSHLTRGDFLLTLDCEIGADGGIDLALSLDGSTAVEQDPRELGIGLVRFLYLPREGEAETVPPATLIQPSAPTDRAGNPIVPHDLSALQALARQSAILGDGWTPVETGGTWLDAPTAAISFKTSVEAGQIVRVALRVRTVATRSGALLKLRSGCGASASLTLPGGDVTGLLLWLDCQVGVDCRVTVSISAVNTSTRTRKGRIGLTGMIYGPRDSVADRLSLTEALMFPYSELQSTEEAEAKINFTVTGHIKGSYSLATVNRRLALSIEKVAPGTVRVEQVEGRSLHDLSHLPSVERLLIKPLTERGDHEDGSEVVISQHWPVWVPPRPGDLSLAYVFWEESLLPTIMVDTLNKGFKGVIASSLSVAKAVTDSGVLLPVRVVGFAPDLTLFKEAAERRPLKRRPITTATAFSFLHVSSCFPRKGIDVLLAAFVQAFRRSDPVRLVIKGFSNPHNTVAAQLETMRASDPELPQIEVIEADLLPSDILNLYEAADAMVLPTRGEGYNIPAAEALAAGLPLIVTGFGAHTDFATAEMAQLIDYCFAPSRSHLASEGSVWVDPDVDSLAAALRMAFDRAQSALAGDVGAAASLATQIAKGRACAEGLTDDVAWVERITAAARELLFAPIPTAPIVAWISTWNVRCGIAEYSRMLLNQFNHDGQKLTILCDERTEDKQLTAPHGWAVVPAWRVLDPRTIDRLAQSIDDTGADLVLIQHHPGLLNWPELTTLLTDVRLARRKTIITMHNVRDLGAVDPARLPQIVAALSTVSRILVHTVRDLNLLKGHGLVANVTLFPQGADRQDIVPRTTRTLDAGSAPLIGSYGFFLPHKGFERLIRAFAKIRLSWPAARLRLVTSEYPLTVSANELTRCREIAASLGLKSAIEWHTAYLENAASFALLNECDLVVLPYQETPESSSAAVRNAICSRAPVAVTPIGIFDDMGDAVLRLSGTGEQAIVAGIAEFLGDADARSAVQAHAGVWLQHHDWAMLGRRLNQIGRGLVATPSRGNGIAPPY